MTILRTCLLAFMMTMASMLGVLAQTGGADLSTYEALSAAQPADAQAETSGGLYENLRPEDYAQVAEDMSMLTETHLNLAKLRSNAGKLLRAVPTVGPELATVLQKASPNGEATYFLGVLAKVLAFMAVSHFLVWRIYAVRMVGPWFIGLQKPEPQGIVEKLPILAIRAMLGIVGVALFLILTAVMAALSLDLSHEATQKALIVMLLTAGLIRVSIIIWRMVLSPYLSNYRIPCMGDRESKRLFNWLWVTVAFSTCVTAFCYWIADIGVGEQAHGVITIVATLMIVVANVAMVLVNRRTISDAIQGECTDHTATWMGQFSSVVWAPLAILYFVGAWLGQTYRLLMGAELTAPLIVGAYTVLLAVLVAYGVVAFAIARIFHRRRYMPEEADEDQEQADPEAAQQSAELALRLRGMRDFEDLARRVATLFAAGAGAYALLYIWRLDHMLEEGKPLDRIEDMIDIFLVSYIAYHAVRIWVDQKIMEEGGAEVHLEPGDEGGAGSVSRLATLLPLFRNFMLFSIMAAAVVMFLLELGVNVAPIFAGAGVAGLAIGFGAQALIRDILSGAFFLIDDAFRKGEYIDVGEVKGTVERISIRSFQLRHHLGALHTIPFGEIRHLTNFSRDWVMMKLPLRLTYDTDVEKVRKLIKNLGKELLAHDTEGVKFMQPLKSQGVYKMEDSAMIIRVKYMTKPGDQWTTRKLVYAKIRELFEREGVKFAHREVTVRVAGRNANELSDDDMEAVGAAARAIGDIDEGPMKKAVGDDR